MTADANAIDDLVTVRDWLRFAISRFNRAGLSYGHGTSRAIDDAAFLILETLSLAPDVLDPWLDARLTRTERQAILHRIERRIATRKPTPYLVNAAYIQGHRFYVDERVIVPRSYIGELLCGEPEALVTDPAAVARVLDLCTGSGCLAILAALAYPEASVDAADISSDALAVAGRNVRDYELQQRVRLVEGDLFAGLAGNRYDLIVSNPPYVTSASVAAFPPEHRAEPVLAHLGGSDGLSIVRRILADAPAHLAHGGTLIVEIGTGRDLLEAEYPQLPFLWRDTAESEGEVFSLTAEAFAPPLKTARGRKKS